MSRSDYVACLDIGTTKVSIVLAKQAEAAKTQADGHTQTVKRLETMEAAQAAAMQSLQQQLAARPPRNDELQRAL